MKKLVAGMLMLVSVGAFAYGGRGSFDGQRQSGGNFSRNFNQREIMPREGRRLNPIYEELTDEQQEKLETLREKFIDATEELILDLKSKNLEVEKLLIEDEIDWTKVEKQIEETEKIETKLELLKLKHREEVQEITGNEFPMGPRGGMGNQRARRGQRGNRR